jgi:hypothetical protein
VQCPGRSRRRHIIGLEADRLSVILQGAIEVAFTATCNAPVVVIVAIIRIEADCFGVIRQGAIEIILGAPCNAPVVVGLGVIGHEADRLSITPDFFIRVGGIESVLKPFLCRQFLLADRGSRAGGSLLGFGGRAGAEAG